MTREEAIQVLNMVEAHGTLVIQAKEIAIEALEQVTSYETTIAKLTQAISEQEPKIGYWIFDKERLGYWISTCSECGHIFHGNEALIYKPKFCANCGAKMAEPKESEDCRNCKRWEDCPCGKEGHENGTSQGYSIGECKDCEPQEK